MNGDQHNDVDEDDEDLSPEQLAKEMEEAEKESREFDSIVEHLDKEPEQVAPEELVAHKFKKEAFNPFSPTICKHCRKYIFGIRKAYMCQGTFF